mmetsp:Transcript_16881/g.20335  ORF Transcript_16881/g.20335 Transcript_16881/m.20335 type:complete len:95 (-) Transcript_16881:287-571(-)
MKCSRREPAASHLFSCDLYHIQDQSVPSIRPLHHLKLISAVDLSSPSLCVNLSRGSVPSDKTDHGSPHELLCSFRFWKALMGSKINVCEVHINV